MSKTVWFFATIFLIASGVLFFLYQRDMLIVQVSWVPHLKMQHSPQVNLTTTKSTLIFYFKNNHQWKHEKTSLVWDMQNPSTTLHQLCRMWTKIMQQEKIIPNHITIDSVVISQQGGLAFLNFDRPLFYQHYSISDKWMVIESLIKTIKKSTLPIDALMFLQEQKPMIDDHLDFSQAIPCKERTGEL